MGPITKFLRRHHHHNHRRHFLSHPLLNPNPNPLPSSSSAPILFNRSQPQRSFLNPTNPRSLPSILSTSRSFTWTPWSHPSNSSTGSDTGSNFSSDGPGTRPEAPDLGFRTSGNPDGIGSGLGSVDGSGTELEVPKLGLRSLEASEDSNGSGLSSVDGSGTGLEVVDLEEHWWSPVRMLISVMDGFHDVSGLPWWLVISASTLAFRVALIPVLILQLKKAERIKQLMPKLPPLLPPPLSGRSFREQYLLFRKKRRELGCPPYLWSFASFTVQLPCFLLGMTSIRRMCLDHHPGFDNGGILWFQNLTDFPHGILGLIFPVLIASLHSANVQISFEKFKPVTLPGTMGSFAKYYRLYLDVLAIPFLFIGLFIPQGSLVYWVTNSSLSLIQQLTLKNPYIRNKLGLTEEKVQQKKMPTDNVMLENGVPSQNQFPAEALSPEKLLDLSLKYIAAGHQDEALPLLRVATDKDPELVRALIAIGQILCSEKSFEEAAEYFERAISKIQPEEDNDHLVLAIFGAGVSRIWEGKKSEGIHHLKKLADLKEPEGPMDKVHYYKGLVILGSTLFGEGEKTEAAKYLRIAAAYDPGVNVYLKECEEG